MKTPTFDDVRLKRYYCASIETSSSIEIGKRFETDPRKKPKGELTQKQKEERETRCKLYVVVKENEGKYVRIVSPQERF